MQLHPEAKARVMPLPMSREVNPALVSKGDWREWQAICGDNGFVSIIRECKLIVATWCPVNLAAEEKC
jgi:hypothetical protein